MKSITQKEPNPCPKCGSYLYRYSLSGPHIKKTCACCNSFIKFVPEQSAPMDIIKIRNSELEKERFAKVYNYTLEYESWLKMVTEIVEAEDNGQNA